MRRFFVIFSALVLLAGCSIFSQPEEPGEETKNPNRVERPEYKDVDVDSRVADPDALVLKPNKQAVKYKGEPVVQACDVISSDDLRKADQLLHADSYPNNVMTRTYFNGESKGEVDTSIESANNECWYVLHGKSRKSRNESIEINVYEPAYTNQKELATEIKKNYKAIADIEGVKAYQMAEEKMEDHTGRFTDYRLQQGTITAHIYTSIIDEKVVKSLLQTAAKRLKQLEAKPTGPSQVDYKSPVFAAGYVNSCDYIGNEDFQNLFGVDADPLVTEGISSSVGVEDSDHYLKHNCSLRENPENNQVLSMKTTAYEDEKTAALHFKEGKKEVDGDSVQEVSSIGDDAYYAVNEVDGEWSLTFRQGRVEVQMDFYDYSEKEDPSSDEEIAEKRIERLTPIAQAVVERMKDV
ncbi:lipoprotein [Desmospora activa]|nr:lipoprotein [Desmospora activa]